MSFTPYEGRVRSGGCTWAALLFIVLAPTAGAQSNTAVVEGRVADPTGAPVADCSVALTNLQTTVELTMRSNDAGAFIFPSVPVGRYTLKITKDGFKAYERTDFRVSLEQRVTLDVALELGAVSESVTVEAAGAGLLVEQSSNELGTLIEPVNVQQLPLNGRSYLQLGYLSGAAQDGGPTSSDFLATQTGHAYRDITVAGVAPDQIGFTVNGISVAGSRLGDLSIEVSISAVDQFKVVQGFIMPSMGPDPGIVNVVTKSGANRFHGEIFEFLRNNHLDARRFFEQRSDAGPFHRNQFGGGLSGPIVKNKLFFFANYEGLRETRATPLTGFAPTQAMFGGDFSAIPTTIYDPQTIDSATGLRQPFPGNTIPVTRINGTAQKLLQYYTPGSSYQMRPSNVFGEPVQTQTSNQGGIRIDANLSQSQQLFGQYLHEVYPVYKPALFPASGLYYDMNTEVVMVQLTSTLTPQTVNELHAGFVRPFLFYGGIGEDGVQAKVGVTGTADSNGVPGINLAGFSSFGTPQSIIGNIDNSYQLADSLKLLRGNHAIDVGGILRYMRTTQESANWNARGTLVFNSVFTAQLQNAAPAPNTGSSFADFLLGMPVNGTVTSMPRTHYRWTELNPYIQDTWRVTPTLTINLGVGWYLATPPNPSGNDVNYPHAFDRQTGKVLYAAIGQVDPKVFSMDLNNVSPRAGIAWRPSFLKDTVIRAGAGIYYPSQRALYDLFGITAPGVSIVQSIANSTSGAVPTYILGQNVFPPISQVPITAEFAENVTGTVFALDTGLRSAYTEQWNLSIQRSVGASSVVEVAYIGSQSHNLPVRRNIDDCSTPDSLICNPAIRPWPQYSYVYFASNEAFANYNALTTRFQREFSKGFSFLANYTWSKVITNTIQGGANSPLNQRGTCLFCDKGRAPFDVPQRLAVASVWALPVGRGQSVLTNVSPGWNRVVGGWAVNAIAVFASGNPFTVNAPNNTTAPLTNFRANRVCNGRGELENKDVRNNGLYWINPSCFAAPAAGYFGNSGVNILTGPGVNNWDIGIEKNVPVSESVNLQIRAEFFNAWNHAQFMNPDTLVGNPTFGQVNQVRSSREIQLGMKLLW